MASTKQILEQLDEISKQALACEKIGRLINTARVYSSMANYHIEYSKNRGIDRQLKQHLRRAEGMLYPYEEEAIYRHYDKCAEFQTGAGCPHDTWW
jgi:hypothetical protein